MNALPMDHVVYVAPDLAAAVDDLETRLGVRASPGGQHAGLGTRNALFALSNDAYLEVIGPDPEQPAPGRPRPFGIDALAKGRIVTWAVRTDDLDAAVARARRAGYDPGTALPLSRTTPAGDRLEWRLTLRAEPAAEGLVPFLIDWGTTPHPALGAAVGCRSIALRGEHPQPARVLAELGALGVALGVERAATAALVLELETPRGRLELR